MNLSFLVRSSVDRILGGRGEHSITVPVMDGPLRPNDDLERAERLAHFEGMANLVEAGGELLFSQGSRILKYSSSDDFAVVAEEAAPISCLAASPGGVLAVGLDGVGLKIIGGTYDGRIYETLGEQHLNCVTAAMFESEDVVILSNGSSQFLASQWRHDLLSRNELGSVLQVDLQAEKSTTLASGLSFPSGICPGKQGSFIIAEAWKHRLISIGSDNRTIGLANLPAYPGRVARASQGGYWLCCFAVRSQLQEFVLREPRYRKAMMADVDPEFWIAPTLSSGHSFKEPLQAGGVIRLGIHKPWAPTRSYGLVVRLDANLRPLWSAHSRADGTRHGVTALVERANGLLVVSEGSGDLLVIKHIGQRDPIKAPHYEESAL